MTDQPQPSQYPGFEITAQGLQKLHQALGMYLHQALEQDLARTKRDEEHQRRVAALIAQSGADEQAPAAVTEQAPPVPLRTPKAQGG